MSPSQDYHEQEFEYQVNNGRVKTPQVVRAKSPRYSRGGKSPQSFNGIHRRRKRRMSW